MSKDCACQSTTQDVTLWVDSAKGNDCNSGVQDAPLKTIGAAVCKIPLVVRHTVTVNVRAGIYPEALDLVFLFADTGRIEVVGLDWKNFTPATGIQSGTFDAIFGVQTIPNTATCAGGGWTADDLKGKFILITSGVDSGEYLPIASNTTITIDFGMPADRITGDGVDLHGQTFSIVEHAVILEQQGAFDHLIAVTGASGTQLSPPRILRLPERNSGIHFRNFQFSTGSAFRALSTGSGGVLHIHSCKFSFSTASLYGYWGSRSGGVFVATDCYWAMLPAAGVGVAGGGGHTGIRLANCIMEGGSTAGIVDTGSLHISGLYQNQQWFGVSSYSGSVRCFTNLVLRGQAFALNVGDTTEVKLQPAVGCGFIMSATSAGIRIARLTHVRASSNGVQLSNLIIDNCTTGVQIEGAYNEIDLQNSTIKNNSAWGVNMAADKHAGFNSVTTNSLTVMSGNTDGDFTMDSITPLSLADLRADPDKDISNSVRFNRLFEV